MTGTGLDVVDPLDWLRVLNAVLATHGLALMWLLRNQWRRQGRRDRLTLIGFGLLQVATFLGSVDAVLIDAKPSIRVPLYTLALLVVSTGLRQTRRHIGRRR